MPPLVMYCFVSAISMNSRSTPEVTFSSTVGSLLISADSVSISASSRLLNTFADTSAPMAAKKMAALRAPEKTSPVSGAMARSRGHHHGVLLLHEPRAKELRRGVGLGVRHRERFFADVLALARQLQHVLGHDRLRRAMDARRRGRGRRCRAARGVHRAAGLARQPHR